MDLNSYFKNIAETHKDILHTKEKPCFFREYSSARILLDTTFHTNLRYAGTNVLISQFNDDGQLPTPQNDFKRNRDTGSLYILSRIKDSDMEAARLETIELRDDIIAKINEDQKARTIPLTFSINDISSHTVGRLADNFFCTMLVLSISDSYKHPYNSEKWISA